MASISLQQIELATLGLREDLEQKRTQHAELGAEIQRIERELALLSELSRIRGGQPLNGGSGPSPVDDQIDSHKGSLGDTVVGILRGRGQQMHIQELLTTVRALEVPIPGRGDAANLISHIRIHPEIVRPVRGMYALREWGVGNGAHVAAARHRRRRRKTRSRPGN